MFWQEHTTISYGYVFHCLGMYILLEVVFLLSHIIAPARWWMPRSMGHCIQQHMYIIHVAHAGIHLLLGVFCVPVIKPSSLYRLKTKLIKGLNQPNPKEAISPETKLWVPLFSPHITQRWDQPWVQVISKLSVVWVVPFKIYQGCSSQGLIVSQPCWETRPNWKQTCSVTVLIHISLFLRSLHKIIMHCTEILKIRLTSVITDIPNPQLHHTHTTHNSNSKLLSQTKISTSKYMLTGGLDPLLSSHDKWSPFENSLGQILGEKSNTLIHTHTQFHGNPIKPTIPLPIEPVNYHTLHCDMVYPQYGSKPHPWPATWPTRSPQNLGIA